MYFSPTSFSYVTNGDLGKVVSNERLTTIILDALREEKYAAVEVKPVRYPDLGLEETISTMKTIFINHSERSSIPQKVGENSLLFAQFQGKRLVRSPYLRL